MNRIVLIGNGFDLAHGLKTKYEDFINWYWEDMGRRLLHGVNRTEDDGLCSFIIKDDIKVRNWASVFQGWYYKRDNPLISWDVNDVVSLAKQDKNLCDFKMSPFFERIQKSIETKGWVDIEYEYYSLLVLLHSYVKDNYLNLNNQLDSIREKLIVYLTSIGDNVSIIDGIKAKIYRPIRREEIAVANINYSTNDSGEEITPSNILLLNFNYTKTPELYIENGSDIKINYIHGKLENPKSVIFGYGDELDQGYQKLRNKNENECLRHMKSIRYLESANYRKVLEFIESAPFQVCIMGHSCGNSDRTLLNTLFEHKNCISVKPYYYKKKDETDNYLDIIQNISRNFTDMKLMRDRVVNKTYCEPLT